MRRRPLVAATAATVLVLAAAVASAQSSARVSPGPLARGLWSATAAVASGRGPAAGPGPAASPSPGGPTVVAPTLTAPTAEQQQVEADPPVPVPATTPCTETIMVHDFSSYYAPYRGPYSPPSGCPGPWARVVLTLTSSVSGVQFDRLLTVELGGAVLLSGSTSEPCCTGNAVAWTVQRDVTGYTSLLMTDQSVFGQLDNVVNATYTGVYHVTVTLAFYPASATAAAPRSADVVLPVTPSQGPEGMFIVGKTGQLVGTPVTFPRNLVRLTGELFASGHGPCEEFWWGEPETCGVGTPYREIGVYLDGQLAGAAPVYPVTFTGLDGPGLWEPIPSPRAWNMRPYDVDLTPFVGLLTDGAPHQVDLGVLDGSIGAGDYWPVAANLLGWVDHDSGMTRGALTAVTAPAAPTDAVTADPSGQNVAYTDAASHELSFTGWVRTEAGLVTTTTVHEVMAASDTSTPVTTQTTWTWRATSTALASRPGGTTRTVTEDDATYGLDSEAPARLSFTDAATDSVTTDGTETSWNSFNEAMDTAGPTGIAFNGVERETYRYADETGACYDHTIGAVAGELVLDFYGSNCGSAPVPPVPLRE